MQWLFLFCTLFVSDSLQNHSSLWKECTPQTLVVFDVDDTLISTEDQYFHSYNSEFLAQLISELIEGGASPDQLSPAFTLPNKCLVEEGTPPLIETLQRKGVPVMGLTFCPTGPFGSHMLIEDWRAAELKNLGIELHAFQGKELNFTHVHKPGCLVPLFVHGMLFCQGYSKGEILLDVLSQMHISPSHVIFIDDSWHNVEDVHTHLSAKGIRCTSIHYTAAQRLHKQPDEKLIRLQFEHLLEKGTWLSDKEALFIQK